MSISHDRILRIARKYAEANDNAVMKFRIMETPSITWYGVGRNASHYFFLGTEDGNGRVWRSSYELGDYEWAELLGADGEPLELEHRIARVDPIARFAYCLPDDSDTLPYIGHF